MIQPRTETYKSIDGVDLSVEIFEPRASLPRPRPAVVFFFGGGWSNGATTQFHPQARYFASRGMVAMTADYRVKVRHGVTPFECIADAKSCIRWARANAQRLGVRSDAIVAAGGSAGAHLAATCCVCEGYDEPREDTAISSAGNAMVLFNPVLGTTPGDWGDKRHNDFIDGLVRTFGDRGKDVSPLHNVRPGLPPAIVFHGEDDATVPFLQPKLFAERMQAAGNRCELLGFPGKGHGFFNFGRDKDNASYLATVDAADRFLASLGLLEGGPNQDAMLAAGEAPPG